MSPADRDALAERLAAVAAAVPGVALLHPPRLLGTSAVAAVTGRRLRVAEREGVLEVEVELGVEPTSPARSTGEAVAAALLAVLDETGVVARRITVRIASVL